MATILETAQAAISGVSLGNLATGFAVGYFAGPVLGVAAATAGIGLSVARRAGAYVGLCTSEDKKAEFEAAQTLKDRIEAVGDSANNPKTERNKKIALAVVTAIAAIVAFSLLALNPVTGVIVGLCVTGLVMASASAYFSRDTYKANQRLEKDTQRYNQAFVEDLSSDREAAIALRSVKRFF